MPSPIKRGCAVKDLGLQFWVDLLKLTDGWCRRSRASGDRLFFAKRAEGLARKTILSAKELVENFERSIFASGLNQQRIFNFPTAPWDHWEHTRYL